MRRVHVSKAWRAWVCLLLIALAEFLTLISPHLGLGLHAVLLIGLIIQGSWGQPGPEQNLLLSLTLAPLLRLLSFSLPLAKFPQLLWYPLVMLPIMSATWITARLLRLPLAALGLRLDNWWLQFMAAPAGLAIGVAEYLILKPEPIISGDSWGSYALAALLLGALAGFGEELLFRGLILPLAHSSMKWRGIIFVSLLFAALHIGYNSPVGLLLAFVSGILFALLAYESWSILGVSLAHGMANVTLFLVMPYIAHAPSYRTITNAFLGCSALAVALVAWKLRRLKRVGNAHGNDNGIQAHIWPYTADYSVRGSSARDNKRVREKRDRR